MLNPPKNKKLFLHVSIMLKSTLDLVEGGNNKRRQKTTESLKESHRRTIPFSPGIELVFSIIDHKPLLVTALRYDGRQAM